MGFLQAETATPAGSAFALRREGFRDKRGGFPSGGPLLKDCLRAGAENARRRSTSRWRAAASSGTVQLHRFANPKQPASCYEEDVQPFTVGVIWLKAGGAGAAQR